MSALVGSLELESRTRQGLLGAGGGGGSSMIGVGLGAGTPSLGGGDYGNVFSDRDIEELFLYIDSVPGQRGNPCSEPAQVHRDHQTAARKNATAWNTEKLQRPKDGINEKFDEIRKRVPRSLQKPDNTSLLAGVAEYIKTFRVRTERSAVASSPAARPDASNAGYGPSPCSVGREMDAQNLILHQVIVEESDNGCKVITITSPHRDWLRSDVSIALHRLSLEICKAEISTNQDRIRDVFHVKCFGEELHVDDIKQSLENVVCVKEVKAGSKITTTPSLEAPQERLAAETGRPCQGSPVETPSQIRGVGLSFRDSSGVTLCGGFSAEGLMSCCEMAGTGLQDSILMGSFSSDGQGLTIRDELLLKGGGGKMLGSCQSRNRGISAAQEDRRRGRFGQSSGDVLYMEDISTDVHNEKRRRISAQ